MIFGRTHLPLVLAVLLAAFLALHPYLDAAGLCGLGECPEPSQPSHAAHAGANAGFSTVCLAAVLAASGVATAGAFASFLGRRRATDQRRPSQTHLSPDTPPPRASSSR